MKRPQIRSFMRRIIAVAALTVLVRPAHAQVTIGGGVSPVNLGFALLAAAICALVVGYFCRRFMLSRFRRSVVIDETSPKAAYESCLGTGAKAWAVVIVLLTGCAVGYSAFALLGG